MTTVEIGGGGVNDLGQEVLAGATGGVPGGAGLVLPDEVVADLAAQLAARAGAGGPVALTGRDGLLAGMIGQVLRAGLGLELEEHLAAGGDDGNGRNGCRAKTLRTGAGPVTVSVPRDRDGSFDPLLVPRGARRTSGISGTVVSLYSGGMSVRDIARHCQRAMGIEISHDTISKITDGVLEEVRAWQSRPLEAIYPVVYIDALVAKVRAGGSVRNKAVNIAVGVDCGGVRHVLGIWVAPCTASELVAGAVTWGLAGGAGCGRIAVAADRAVHAVLEELLIVLPTLTEERLAYALARPSASHRRHASTITDVLVAWCRPNVNPPGLTGCAPSANTLPAGALRMAPCTVSSPWIRRSPGRFLRRLSRLLRKSRRPLRAVPPALALRRGHVRNATILSSRWRLTASS